MKKFFIFWCIFLSFIGITYSASLDDLYTKKTYGPFLESWVTLWKDGKEFSIGATNSWINQYEIYKNGKLITGYLSTFGATYSPDWKHFAFIAKKKNNNFVIINDGKESKEHVSAPNNLIYSTSGKHLAYIIQTSTGNTLIQDNVEVQHNSMISDPVYSPDENSIAYTVSDDYASFYLIKDKEIINKYYQTFSPIYSPKNSSFIFIAQKNNGKYVLVQNGIEGKEYEHIGNSIFSPDGKHTAYSALKSWNCLVIQDGIEGKEYIPLNKNDWSCISDLTFSLDSQYLSYNVNTNKGSIIINNTNEISKYDWAFFVSYLWNSWSKIVYVATKKGKNIFDYTSKIIKDWLEFPICNGGDILSPYPLVNKNIQSILFSIPSKIKWKCVISMDWKLSSRDSYDDIKLSWWVWTINKDVFSFVSKKDNKYYINIWTRKQKLPLKIKK